MSGEEEVRRVTVKIMGEEYVLRSSKSREHMLEVGEHVNRLMAELAEKYPRMSTQKIAVLTSLNLASDLLSLLREEEPAGTKTVEKAEEKTEEKMDEDKNKEAEKKAEKERNKKNKHRNKKRNK